MKIVALVQDKVREEIKSSEIKSVEIRNVVIGFSSPLVGWAEWAGKCRAAEVSIDFSGKHAEATALQCQPQPDEEISQMVTVKRDQKLFRDFQFGALLTLMEQYSFDDVSAMTTMSVTKPRPEVASNKSGYYFATSFDQPLKMIVPVEDRPMIESTLTQSSSMKAAMASVKWADIAAQIKSRSDEYWKGVAFAPSQYDVADLMNHTHIGSGMSYYRNSYASAATGIEPAKWPDDEWYSLKA